MAYIESDKVFEIMKKNWDWWEGKTQIEKDEYLLEHPVLHSKEEIDRHIEKLNYCSRKGINANLV